MQKLQGYKEKMVKMQMKLKQIENKVQYKDVEKFGFYKVLIEDSLKDLEIQILGLEANLENINSLIDSELAFSKLDDAEISKMLCEEVKYFDRFISPTVEEIEENIEKSVK